MASVFLRPDGLGALPLGGKSQWTWAAPVEGSRSISPSYSPSHLLPPSAWPLPAILTSLFVKPPTRAASGSTLSTLKDLDAWLGQLTLLLLLLLTAWPCLSCLHLPSLCPPCAHQPGLWELPAALSLGRVRGWLGLFSPRTRVLSGSGGGMRCQEQMAAIGWAFSQIPVTPGTALGSGCR